MATEVVMPKQGNSVEACIILEWKVKEGDTVAIGDVVCEAETDKSTIEVESTAEGTVLKLLYAAGDEVPVMQAMMIVGEKGEQVSVQAPGKEQDAPAAQVEPKQEEKPAPAPVATREAGNSVGVSPRARAAAAAVGLDATQLAPSGPKGRVIERDVLHAAEGRAPLSPVAREALAAGTLTAPAAGSGIGGRVLSSDLSGTAATPSAATTAAASDFPGAFTETPVKGVRKVTAKRMLESIATTAQFTLNTYADATALQALRQRLKNSPAQLGVQKVTINDIILFAVSRTVLQFPFMNSHFLGDKIVTFEHVHLGCAVDTPKGLLVPVVRYADSRSLKQLSDDSKRLANASIEGKALPEELSGSTFTVTNLGAMGIDTFTPVLNIPEVAILGVGGISMRAVEDSDGDYAFVPHIALSLTINHQAVDGAPAARFLKALCDNIAAIDTLLAL